MAFDVKVITDSIGPNNKRLTTITSTHPRIIHSEVLTHRDRERNAASSRAIPFPVMTEMILDDPFVPIFWGSEGKGMQTGPEIPEELRPLACRLWLDARDDAVRNANRLHAIGETYFSLTGDSQYRDVKIHKSLPNRLLEPFAWITVVMTATEWNNFFRLRCHPDAEVHFQKIAGMIRDALKASTPKRLREGEWHLPFMSKEDDEPIYCYCDGDTSRIEDIQLKCSTARVARVSFLTHEGKRSIHKDMDLFNRLVEGSGFGHWSPHGHPGQATTDPNLRSGPFVGWKQYRKTFANENAAG